MKKVMFALLALMTMLVAVSCGGEKDADMEKKLNIAVISKGYQHEFWRTVEAGTKKASEELGVDVYFVGPERETEVAKQVEMVENAMNREVDAVAIAATDANGLQAVTQKALDSGIPVVSFDSDVAGQITQSFIATDNVAAAYKAGEEMARILGGKGKIAIVAHNAGTTSAIEREKGFRDALAKYPDITILNTQYSDGDRAKALAITQDFLTANPDLKGIFGSNEGSSVGMARGVEESGRKGELVVVGFDASPDMITFLDKGIFDAIIVQDPFNMGYLTVVSAVKLINGETVEKMTDTGSKLVTKENMATPEMEAILYPLGKE